MCGIYAIISRTQHGLVQSDQDILKQMMLDTVQRGDNSSGLFMTDYRKPTNPPTGVKVLGGPHNIIYNKPLWTEIGDHLQRTAGAIVGHGRYATKGKVTAENAHPFQHEHITLVHNGTIHGGVSYAKKGEQEIDVDSHALCVAIAEKGIMEALADVRGAYAIIAHDAKEGCLYIARNTDRPLHIYSTSNRHYIMSEGGFLETIMARYGKTEKDQHVMYFKPEQLVRIDLNEPNTYFAYGNIAELRQQKEAAEREAEEERRKKYSRPANNAGWNVRNASKNDEKERYVPEKELKGVTFKVESVESFGTNYKYRGTTVDGLPMHFISDQRTPEYVGRLGGAKIHSYVFKKGQQHIFVRHRDINWFDQETTSGEQEDPAGEGTFRTANNKRIKANDWFTRIINEGCDQCDETFKQLDYRNVYLTDDDKFLCSKCAFEFNVGQSKQGVH